MPYGYRRSGLRGEGAGSITGNLPWKSPGASTENSCTVTDAGEADLEFNLGERELVSGGPLAQSADLLCGSFPLALSVFAALGSGVLPEGDSVWVLSKSWAPCH